MENLIETGNGVNGTGTYGEGASPGRNSMAKQHGTGRNHATARRKWSKEENRLVMYCKFKSYPIVRGYRKRMMRIWEEVGTFEVKEQQLVDQARAIVVNEWLTKVELEEIKRQIEIVGMRGSSIPISCARCHARVEYLEYALVHCRYLKVMWIFILSVFNNINNSVTGPPESNILIGPFLPSPSANLV